MSRRSSKDSKKGDKEVLKSLSDLACSVGYMTRDNYIRTGVMPFDDLFGGRGFPRGKIIEFASQEGVGKTTLMTTVSKALVMQGHKVLYVDAEHALDETLLRGVGFTDAEIGTNFIISQTNNYFELSNLMDVALKENLALIVIDSITSVHPKKLMDMNVEDIEPGLKARMESTFLDKFKGQLYKAGISLVLLNQMRTKIRFKGPSTLEPAGGNALKFYADVRFLITRAQFLERDMGGGQKQVYGSDVEIASSKNKITGFHVPVKMTIVFGRGVSNVMYVFEKLRVKGYVKQSSSYFIFSSPLGEQTVQGREAAMIYVKDNYRQFQTLLESDGVVTEASEEKDE